MKTPNARKSIGLALSISLIFSNSIQSFPGRCIARAPKKGCALLYSAFLKLIGKAPKPKPAVTTATKTKKFITKNSKKITTGSKELVKAIARKMPKDKRVYIGAMLTGGALAILYFFKDHFFGKKGGPEGPNGSGKGEVNVKEKEENQNLVDENKKIDENIVNEKKKT